MGLDAMTIVGIVWCIVGMKPQRSRIPSAPGTDFMARFDLRSFPMQYRDRVLACYGYFLNHSSVLR